MLCDVVESLGSTAIASYSELFPARWILNSSLKSRCPPIKIAPLLSWVASPLRDCFGCAVICALGLGPLRYNSCLGGADSECWVLKGKDCLALRLRGLARCLWGLFCGCRWTWYHLCGCREMGVSPAGVNVDDVGMAPSYALSASLPLIFFVLTHWLNSGPDPLYLTK